MKKHDFLICMTIAFGMFLYARHGTVEHMVIGMFVGFGIWILFCNLDDRP